MREVKTNIYKDLKRNNIITLSVIISSTLISLASLFYARETANNAKKIVYTTSSKEPLVPLELMDKFEAEKIYKKSHVMLFVNYFYDYDQWNYKNKVEKAFWLIDDIAGKKLYNFYKNEGHYNKMIQSTSIQHVLNVEVKFDANDNFQVHYIIEINKSGQETANKYKIIANGSLKKVSSNYPLNPYGYLIENFTETSKTAYYE